MTIRQQTEKLHNDHNVYILGAGFSADRGLPLIKDFMFRMRDAQDWLHQQNRSSEIDAIARVLEFRREAASAAYRVKIDLENIEELFSLASASTQSHELSDSIRIAIAATLDYCNMNAHVPRTYRLEGGEGLPYLEPYRVTQNTRADFTYELPDYEFFLRAMLGCQGESEGENSIISFNYDTVVEDALSKLGIKFSYGFEDGDVDYSTQNLGIDSEGLRLLKLHGSVNWGRMQSSTDGACTLAVRDSYEEVRRLEEIPELIPPTWRKIFDGSLEKVWLNALQSIQTATRIIVIGFSAPETDNHFKYLLAAGLQSNISLRDIVFVNPESKEVLQKKIDKLFTNPLYSRVSHWHSGLWEYFHGIEGRHSCNRPLPLSYSVGRF